MVVVLGAIIGLLIAMGRVAKSRQGAAPRLASKKSGTAIEVLSRKSLGQHMSLLVVRAGERTLLVGQSAQQMTLLTELNESDWNRASNEHSATSTPNPLAPRPALGEDANASTAWDAIVYRLREMTVRR